MIDEALKIDIADRILILGANEKQIKDQVSLGSFDIIQNKEWEEGMSSSIRTAANFARKRELDALLILLTDQPHVDSKLLKQIMQLYEPECIVASEYNNILGVPALFDRTYFGELLKLEEDTGARKLINMFRDKVKAVKFEKGGIDIDTPEDLNQLNS